MVVRFQNFEYSFKKNNKWIFVPSALGREIGEDLQMQLQAKIQFENFYYHLRTGGHVAALHNHRSNQYFARLDLENFFYSIFRNRVARVLKECGIDRHLHYAKWSTVKNPLADSGYVVPFGFIQSPLVASLVLQRSPIGTALTNIHRDITVSVYVDDIAISSNSQQQLIEAFGLLEEAISNSGFLSNERKARAPAKEIEIFNCALQYNSSAVTPERIDAFNLIERSIHSKLAFENYCTKVAYGNLKE